MIEIRVPDEQEGTKAIVRAWLKQVGDTVAVNDPLLELETDKVTQEVSSPAAGVLSEILLDTDAEAVPGALLGRIESSSPAKAGVQEPCGPTDCATPRVSIFPLRSWAMHRRTRFRVDICKVQSLPLRNL